MIGIIDLGHIGVLTLLDLYVDFDAVDHFTHLMRRFCLTGYLTG